MDEDIYLSHAVRTMEGLGFFEGSFHEAPYFGWLFLAGIFSLIGYPNSLGPIVDGNTYSIEMIYLVPRIIMGLLAGC